MRTIKCQICGKEVEATNNRQKYCPECKKIASRELEAKRLRERRANDPEYREKVNARERERYASSEKRREQNKQSIKRIMEDPERHEARKAKKREWYEANREQHLAKVKERYENNKEKIAEQHKKWYEENKVLADREGNNFCVYIHTDPLGKVYIGRAVGDDVKTVNRQRWGGGSGYKKCPRFWEAIQEFGWDNIQHELLEWGLTYEQVLEREQYWIKRYNSRNPEYGYNVA